MRIFENFFKSDFSNNLNELSDFMLMPLKQAKKINFNNKTEKRKK